MILPSGVPVPLARISTVNLELTKRFLSWLCTNSTAAADALNRSITYRKHCLRKALHKLSPRFTGFVQPHICCGYTASCSSNNPKNKTYHRQHEERVCARCSVMLGFRFNKPSHVVLTKGFHQLVMLTKQRLDDVCPSTCFHLPVRYTAVCAAPQQQQQQHNERNDRNEWKDFTALSVPQHGPKTLPRHGH